MSKKRTTKKHSAPKELPPQRWQAVPLKGSFMITAILGIFISIYFVWPRSFQFGLAFTIVFVAMFIAAMISMTKAPVLNERNRL